MRDYLTPNRAAALTGRSAAAIRKAVADQSLPAEVTPTGRVKIAVADLEQWAERQFSALELLIAKGMRFS